MAFDFKKEYKEFYMPKNRLFHINGTAHELYCRSGSW